MAIGRTCKGIYIQWAGGLSSEKMFCRWYSLQQCDALFAAGESHCFSRRRANWPLSMASKTLAKPNCLIQPQWSIPLSVNQCKTYHKVASFCDPLTSLWTNSGDAHDANVEMTKMGWCGGEWQFQTGTRIFLSQSLFLLSHELKQSSEWIYRPKAYGLVTITWIGSVSIKINDFLLLMSGWDMGVGLRHL